jgi:ribulose 1,5-bisphosphate synthetase/thiazole synthase
LFFTEYVFLKITSYIKRHHPIATIATKTILSERLNPYRIWGGGGGGGGGTKLIKYVSTEEKDDILEELDL